MDRRKDSALWYAKRGWKILPIWPIRDGVCACGANDDKPGRCKSAGKHPIGFLVPDGISSATCDKKTIQGWWDRVPDANLATTSFLRVDVDTKHNGKDNWREVSEVMGVPETVHCMTPSGGDHFYFCLPPGRTHGNAKGNLPGGIDIRGHEMGYTLLPPSNHLQGIYEWELSSRPDEIEIAIAPEWLLATIEDETSRYTASFGRDGGRPNLDQWELSSIVRGIIEDDRSRVDQAIITALVRCGASDDDIRGVFRHYPTTGKYAEKGPHQDNYLALSISRARGFVDAHPDQYETPILASAPQTYTGAVSAYRQRRQ